MVLALVFTLACGGGIAAQSQASGGGAVAAPATGNGTVLDGRLSQLYVREASTAFRAKEWAAADHLLDLALEFNPSNSDAYYLRGEILLQQLRNIPGAIAAFSKALDRASFGQFDAAECKMKLAPLLIRTKQYERAYRLLGSLSSDSQNYLLDYALALDRLGRATEARNTLEAAIQAYPEDYQLVAARIAIDPVYRAALAERFLKNQDIGRFPPSIAVDLIRATSDAARKESLISLYNRSYPASPEVFAESLLVAPTVSNAEIDRFVSDGSMGDANLVRELYRSLGNGPARGYLENKIAAYSGRVSLDLNGDGIPEEVANYESGRLASLTYDGDQDGVDEYAMTFASGVPSTLTLAQGDKTFVLTYSQYPFVSSAKATEGDSTTTYTLIPDQLTAPVLAGGTTLPSGINAFPPAIVPGYSITAKQLFAFSAEVSTDSVAEAHPISIWHKSLDDIIHMESDWQKGSFRYKAVFHGNEKVSAMLDVDGDGYFEVKEYYRDGKMWKLSYDGDHDGVPEFILEYEPYPVLSWDYNQDGIMDAVEKRLPNGTTVRMFSTKMNGVFDVVTTGASK